MLILKLTNPEGESRYMAAAFPSACGKTNLAMVVPTIPGWKAETIGDDICWMKFGPDGRLRAINPEFGMFGVAPGTGAHTNPNAVAALSHDTIFTNVAATDDGDVWWEGLTEEPPAHLVDWRGQDWTPESAVPGGPSQQPLHRRALPGALDRAPNGRIPKGSRSRPSSSAVAAPRSSRSSTEAFDWAHGVFLGSIMASETTAAAAGAVGTLRRDPFAMLPFCGYHMGDYFAHWLEVGAAATDQSLLPKIFYVNWFRRGTNGTFLWPGYGENSRVLAWIFERCAGGDGAIETPIGRLPETGALDTEGLDLVPERLDELLAVDLDAWRDEVELIEEHYARFGDRLPDRAARPAPRARQAAGRATSPAGPWRYARVGKGTFREIVRRLGQRPDQLDAPAAADGAVSEAARRNRGSLQLRHVDAGSCNGCELGDRVVLRADLRRGALRHPPRRVPASRRRPPRDGTGHPQHGRPAAQDLRGDARTRLVVAVGDCARDCGVFRGAYGVAGSVADVVPVDVEIPGCPPEPEAIIAALRSSVGEVRTDLLVATALFGLAAARGRGLAPPRARVPPVGALTVAACVCGFAAGRRRARHRPRGGGVHRPAAPAARFLAAARSARRALRRRRRRRRAVRHGLSPRLRGHGLASRSASCVLPFFVTTLLLVPAASTVGTFLFLWEVMAVTSLLFVLADHRGARRGQRAGQWYAVMTHVGAAAMLLALVMLAHPAEPDLRRDRRPRPHLRRVRSTVFVLALLGFGSKAGAVPLHVWLPRRTPRRRDRPRR